MAYGNLISKKVEINEFLETIKGYKSEHIECTNHTFFRLSEKQRKIFKCEKLKEFILHEEPVFVGLQNNGNYAVFYKYEKKTMRMIIDLIYQKINIVSFYFINEVPRV